MIRNLKNYFRWWTHRGGGHKSGLKRFPCCSLGLPESESLRLGDDTSNRSK